MLDGIITVANVGLLVDRVLIFNLPGTINNGGIKSIIGYAAISPRSTQSNPSDTKLVSKELAGLENTLSDILRTGRTYRGLPEIPASVPLR